MGRGCWETVAIVLCAEVGTVRGEQDGGWGQMRTPGERWAGSMASHLTGEDVQLLEKGWWLRRVPSQGGSASPSAGSVCICTASGRPAEHFHLPVASAPSWHRFSSLPWAFGPLSASAGAAVPPCWTTRSGKLENYPRCPRLHPLPLSQAVSVGCFLNIFQSDLSFRHCHGCFHVRQPRSLPGDSAVSPVGLLDTWTGILHFRYQSENCGTYCNHCSESFVTAQSLMR